jgi:diguanylate cyclase (GGDEF)-like protein/putative nucleotidyltransferase with HDIG domain
MHGGAGPRPGDATLTAPTIETHGALAAVRRMSDAVLTGASFDDISEALMRELGVALSLELVRLHVVAPDGSIGRARVMDMRGAAGPAVAEERLGDAADGDSSVRGAIAQRRPLVADDASLLAPLMLAGEVRAVLGLIGRAPREFSVAEVEIAATLVNQAAAGIALRELEHRRRLELEQQTSLARAARSLSGSLELHEILTTLAREADLAVGGDCAGVYLADGTGGGVAFAGHDEPDAWFGSHIGPGEGLGGRVLQTGRGAVTDRYRDEVELPDIAGLAELETAVSLPIRWEGELKGALSVGFRRTRRVSDEDIEVLEAIAGLASMACRNAEAYETARSAARTDALTGVLNHGAMHVRLREEIERARRVGHPLTCVLIDIDNFKALNDRAGHLVGDLILQRVARVLARDFRPYDQIARYGGDEFVLILSGVGLEEARAAAGRVRASIRDTPRAAGAAGAPLQSSIGIALWHEPLGAGELLERADRALLLAKRTGRDRVAVASPEAEHALAMLVGRSGSPSDLMRDFWDMVAGCETPRQAITTLPAFMRRALDLEEVALYEAGPGREPVLRRGADAHLPGDPAPRAFLRRALALHERAADRIARAAVARGSLAELHESLGVRGHDLDEHAPAGSYAAVPLAGPGGLHGVLLLRSAEYPFALDVLQQAEMLARQSLMVLHGQTGGGSGTAVKALAAAIDARDNYTHEHSQEVVTLAEDVARVLELPASEVDRVRTVALLHDVGKVAVPNEILYKPGTLTSSEWEVVRQHPLIGERILQRTPELADVAALVRHEHEHYDGSGYPDGVAGSDIPIASRIILACDAYSAMITRRPYREPMSPSAAIAELCASAGAQFDPAVVDALVRVLGDRE